MKRAKKILSSNKGIALITVILILAILVAAALELNRASRADIYDATNVSDGVRLYYIAKSGFYGAAALLVNTKSSYDSLRDDWAHAEVLSAQSQALFPNGQFLVRIEDEQGKIPLNVLPGDANIQDVFKRLLMQKEFGLDEIRATEIMDSIIDWIDKDDDVFGGRGAESSYYQSLPRPYGAKNAPLDCIEELLMIKGVTMELYKGTKEKPGLEQFVTVYRDKTEQTGAVNPNTAPKLVLRSLAEGITPELADRMDEYRKTRGNDLGVNDWYKKVAGMGEINIEQALLIPGLKSKYFKIYSTGITGNMQQSITGYLYRAKDQGESTAILSWRQD